jgi:dephospho-CoA kinase
MTFCVGLTGGIGCGKSKVADMFAQLGAGIVDTDEISRDLTGQGGSAMVLITQAFGEEYRRSDGSLDRDRMRALVFAEASAKHKLESILHPRIREIARNRIAAAREPYLILVVPLLLETGGYRELLQRVLVVDCSEALQIARTMARSGLTEEEVRRIMQAQIARDQRLKRADDVIFNDTGIEVLRRHVEALHRRYLTLARSST